MTSKEALYESDAQSKKKKKRSVYSDVNTSITRHEENYFSSICGIVCSVRRGNVLMGDRAEASITFRGPKPQGGISPMTSLYRMGLSEPRWLQESLLCR